MEQKNNTFREIWNELKESKNILMSLHPRPDGDSLGSCVAMKKLLEKEGITVKLVSKDKISESLEVFDMSGEVEFGKTIEDENFDRYDWILLLDHGTLYGYSDKLTENPVLKNKIINIDHHETNDYYGRLNYVDKNSPSCTSILFDFFEEMGFEFGKEISRAILLGILTDTGFLEYDKTGKSFEKVGKLIKDGNINYRKEFVIPILKNNPWKLKKLHGILLSNMEKEEINGKNIVYSWATKNDYKKHDLNISDIRLGIICMQDIKDSDVVFNLVELDDKIKGSFRSVDYDTSIYSKEFGGGGHKWASSFMIEKKPMNEAVQDVLRVIEYKGFVKQ